MENPGELILSKGSLHSPEDLACVEVLEGLLWVTEGDGGDDHLVSSGQSRGFMSGSRVVIEALATSRVRLHHRCHEAVSA